MSSFNDNGGTTGIANNGIKDGDEPTVAVTAGTDAVHQGSVPVGTADVLVYTFASFINQGSIQLVNCSLCLHDALPIYIGTAEGGSQTTSKSLVGANGATDQKTVDTGTYYVSETANSPPNFTNYATT